MAFAYMVVLGVGVMIVTGLIVTIAEVYRTYRKW